ncbi:MAG: sulfatase-like hydrolase/transferase [Candidatus Latescibacteria bacterium]|nr:sulfatase-like hydrolase/transferase [Candidatus Latescibacterota bacterium]
MIPRRRLNLHRRNRGKAFFPYLNHTLHHIPHPQESLFNADPRMTQGGYLDRAPDCMPPRREIVEMAKKAGCAEETAYCTWLDMALGAVLERLGEYGLSDDTIVMFLSDNNVPAKGTVYEGGVNVPFMIRYPRMIPGGRITDALVQNIDLAPTAFDLAGATPPQSMILDGMNLMPFLTGEREKAHDDLYFEIGWSRAICTDRWKYLAVRLTERGEKLRLSKKGQFPWVYHCSSLEPHQHHVLLWHPAFYYPDQLYDLNVDGDEIVNLYARPQYRRVLDDMKERLSAYTRSIGRPFGEFL